MSNTLTSYLGKRICKKNRNKKAMNKEDSLVRHKKCNKYNNTSNNVSTNNNNNTILMYKENNKMIIYLP